MQRSGVEVQVIFRLVRKFPKKGLFILSFVCLILLSVMEIAFGHLMKGLLDVVLTLDLQAFWGLTPLTGLLTVLRILLTFLRLKTAGKFSEFGITDLRQRVVNHLVRMPLADVEARHSGDYVSRLNNDIQGIRRFIIYTFEEMILVPVTAIASLAYLAFLSWKLTLISLVVIPLLIMLSSKLSEAISKYSQGLQEQLAVIGAITQDTISGMEVVKAFNLETERVNQYNGAVQQSMGYAKALGKRKSIMQAVSIFISFAPYLVTFGFGGYLVIKGEVSSGSLMAFIYLMSYISAPLEVMPRLLGQIRGDLVTIKRVLEILDEETESNGGQGVVIAKEQAEIRFEQVSFTYEQELVLQKIQLQIQPGQKVALVGPSGGGKSTILKLLLGFYQPTAGQIQVAGESLDQWDLDQLRGQISLVSQNVYLFPGSIRANIGYGKPGATFEEIVHAAKAANAHEFILSLADGYETDVKELGNRLSGGQKQRISIARAILKDAPILLLDEPTSALDTRSERLIQLTLEELMEGRTTVIVAHRYSTIRNVDKIFVVDKGQIVEVGTHAQLLSLGGLYNKLYTKQQGLTGQQHAEEVLAQ